MDLRLKAKNVGNEMTSALMKIFVHNCILEHGSLWILSLLKYRCGGACLYTIKLT